MHVLIMKYAFVLLFTALLHQSRAEVAGYCEASNCDIADNCRCSSTVSPIALEETPQVFVRWAVVVSFLMELGCSSLFWHLLMQLEKSCTIIDGLLWLNLVQTQTVNIFLQLSTSTTSTVTIKLCMIWLLLDLKLVYIQ